MSTPITAANLTSAVIDAAEERPGAFYAIGDTNNPLLVALSLLGANGASIGRCGDQTVASPGEQTITWTNSMGTTDYWIDCKMKNAAGENVEISIDWSSRGNTSFKCTVGDTGTLYWSIRGYQD